MAISDEKYVAFTTYKRDGTAVTTPTWIVPIDDHRAGFWTSSGSGKAKRLNNNPAVTLQPSDGRGRVRAGTEPVAATAALVAEGVDFDTVKRRINAKYGFMTTVSRIGGNFMGFVKRKRIPYGDRVVVITLGAPTDTG